MPGLAGQVAMGIAQRSGMGPDRTDESVVEDLSAPGPAVQDFRIAARAPAGRGDRTHDPFGHAVRFGRVIMAHVADGLRPVGENPRLVGPCDQPGGGRLSAARREFPSDIIDADEKPRGGYQGIAPLLHRPGAGMGRLAMKLDKEPVRAIGVGDDADLHLLGIEDRSLLDV